MESRYDANFGQVQDELIYCKKHNYGTVSVVYNSELDGYHFALARVCEGMEVYSGSVTVKALSDALNKTSRMLIVRMVASEPVVEPGIDCVRLHWSARSDVSTTVLGKAVAVSTTVLGKAVAVSTITELTITIPISNGASFMSVADIRVNRLTDQDFLTRAKLQNAIKAVATKRHWKVCHKSTSVIEVTLVDGTTWRVIVAKNPKTEEWVIGRSSKDGPVQSFWESFVADVWDAYKDCDTSQALPVPDPDTYE